MTFPSVILSSRNKRPLFLALAVLLCVCLVILVPIWTDPYACRMADGAAVGGLKLTGLTKKEARSALETALNEQLLSEDLVLTLPDETIRLTPDQVVQDVDIKKAVRDAYRIGRKDTSGSALELLSYVTLNEAAILDALHAYAAKYDTEYAPLQYQLTGNAPNLTTTGFDETVPAQTLVITLGVPKVKLDVDQLYAEITEACAHVLSAPEDYQITITEIEPLDVPEEPNVSAIYQEFAKEPVNDSLDLETYRQVAGSYGYIFDQEKASDLIAQAQPGETVSIPMEYVTPEILGDQVYFRDELGHCETRHTNDENRNTNLRLLCQFLDGFILQPGEEFSYNEAVGERTPERGFKPANAYSGTRVVKDYGGGVCQGSTTLYNCVLLADLEVLERNCHGATVGYVPLGLDAAVNWSTKTDLRFRNNFHFPIMIKAEVSDGYVRMKILGTDEKDYYIEMHSGSSSEGTAIYAVSRKYKYSKATGELISKDVEARSSYYPLS